jgi:hypothetical protein
VLDRRSWTDLGPDSDAGHGPEDVMRQMGEFVCRELREQYSKITFELTKRAILFSFAEAIDDGDPTVDLVICLTRREQPGYWIPNRDRGRWDASDPEKHTALMTAPPKDLRVHRARVIRLAKAAIKNDEDRAVVCSWNISALALKHVTTTGKLSESLAVFFAEMAASIEKGQRRIRRASRRRSNSPTASAASGPSSGCATSPSALPRRSSTATITRAP